MNIFEKLMRTLSTRRTPPEAAAPVIVHSPDVTAISEKGLAYWRSLAGGGPPAGAPDDERAALRKLFSVYRGRGIDDALAWGRAVEDMADRYPEGYAAYLERRRVEDPAAVEDVRASSRPTLYRRDAEEVVRAIPGRIALLNADDSLPLRVKRAVILGSYLRTPPRQRLRDLDLAVEFEPRDPAEAEAWGAVKEGIEKFMLYARRTPGNPRSVLSDEEERWRRAKEACFSYLMGLSEHLDVSDLSWVEENGFSHKTIYP